MEFWNGGMDKFYRHFRSFKNKENRIHEHYDYLAWRTGESVKSALETTAILSIMTDGKEAKKALKGIKYQEAPAYILIEKQKNKGKPNELTEDEKKEARQKLANWINGIKVKR